MSENQFNNILINSLKLPEINTLDDLSYQMLLSKKLLYTLSVSTEKYYKTFSINKKDGTRRKIDSPKYSLRVVQCWILRNILEKIPLDDNVMGFRKGTEYGIKNNANVHKMHLYILKMDIENFFPSIDRFLVYSIFEGLGYSQFIANTLTNYCMLNEYLPQGASTSPYISNLVFRDIDEKINNYCSNNSIMYSRYADDLTFSSNSRNNLLGMIPIIKRIVEQYRFKINNNKTKVINPNDRKVVTGLIISDNKVRVKRKIKRNLRAMILNDISKNGVLSKKTQGYIAFIKYIEGEEYLKKIENYIDKIRLKIISNK